MKANVEVKLIRSAERIEALRGWIECFDPKAFITPIMPDASGSIFRVRTTLTVDQLRNVRGVAQATAIHETVEVENAPRPVPATVGPGDDL